MGVMEASNAKPITSLKEMRERSKWLNADPLDMEKYGLLIDNKDLMSLPHTGKYREMNNGMMSRLNAKQYGDNVIEAYAPMSNPYTLEDAYFFGGFTPDKIIDDLGIEPSQHPLKNYGNAAGFTQSMKDRGYDGIIVNEIANDMGKINPMQEVVAFNPRKVYTDTYLDEMYSLLR